MTSLNPLNKFDKLYDETYDNVLKYIVCHCSNIEDVKDIVQNTYLELIKALKKDKTEITPSYVFGIAKNKLNEFYRFNYKAKIISLFSKDTDESLINSIPDNINIESNIITKDNIDLVWKFLKKKKVIISKIFYLYYYEELTLKEISDLLNISESNVKNYLYRTQRELINYLRGD